MRFHPPSLQALVITICLTVGPSLVSPLLARDVPTSGPGSGLGFGLGSMSLEELMEVEVTLAGRGEESVFETAAAVSVLSADDIRRSGATTIAESLRLIAGMNVAHVDANKWAVSARGFNGRFANKLLVQIDGRSVYTPTFSGVFWEVQDVVLADVERIEVIRGPGATLWGANAVNGIINVVTRSSDQTQGMLAVSTVGTEERGTGTLRYGGRFGDRLAWRVYGKYFERDGFVDVDGQATTDDWSLGRAGFRADWESEQSRLMIQADAHQGDAGQTFQLADLNPPYVRLFEAETRLTGGHVMGRWHHDQSADASWTLQLFYDRRKNSDEVIEDARDTWDLDFQQHVAWGSRHNAVVGIGYRYTTNETRGSFAASLSPSGRSEDVFGAFFQDEMSLADGQVRLTAGSKLEHNDHTGFEFQPGVRLWWEARPQHAVWAAASRALRVPSQADDDVRLNLGVTPPDPSGTVPLTLFAVVGGNLQPEELSALEVGYRGRPTDELLLDATVFYNLYRGVRGARASGFFTETTPPPLHLVVPFVNMNGLDVDTWGAELAADWRLAGDRWRLRPAYSYLHMRADALNGVDPRVEEVDGENPEHQWSLWLSTDVRADLQLDGVLRYVDGLPTHDFDAYLVGDVRVGWQVTSGVELELVGRNLFDSRHPEFQAFFINSLPTLTQSEMYVRLRWHLPKE